MSTSPRIGKSVSALPASFSNSTFLDELSSYSNSITRVIFTVAWDFLGVITDPAFVADDSSLLVLGVISS